MTSDQEATRIMTEQRLTSVIAPGMVLRQRYRLDSEIGRGGMGIVYRATDLELMREVAVKVLPETTSSSDARQRLIREARAAASLNHPHIISVHDVGEAEGMPFFVMELVHGPSLAQSRPTDFARIVEIGSQICTALEHAHTNSIVHRDLKPENVLLSTSTSSTMVKLADLGLALPSYAARISRVGLIVGTAAYMAPEQALGQTVDGRTDLYALGVLLYELTTGRVPFKGDDPLAVVSQHVHASVVPPRVLRPDMPRALEAVILRLLAKDPDGRFATAADTLAALRGSLEPDNGTSSETADAIAMLDALSRGRLVGRAVELAEVRELWRRAREGRGHAVLLSGEPGAGKTRLAREVTVQAALDSAVVLTGGCYEYEATTPYLPFVEAFRRWVREEKDDEALRAMLGESARQITKLAPEIESRLGACETCPALPPHEERLLFFDAVADVFARLAKKNGLLFYADDLHWADRGTFWLLGHLLRQLRSERVLIVGAYRETELDRAHPLAKSLVDWNRERLVTRIALRRFDQQETSEQLGALLGESVSGDFANAVHRETEGNPFFVEEVLKALIDKGSVRRESGRWKRCDVDELVIPQSVKEAIGSRLDRVSQDCNDVLRAAAVLGKTFTFDELLATAGDQKEDELLDALDEAVGAQLIIATRNDAFTFTHDKIREVLYEELNPIRRRRLHRHAAEAFEKRSTTSHCAVEKLAHHYILAGDYEKGLNYAKQAAAEAVRVYAFEDAIAGYISARDCAHTLELVEEELEQEEAIGKLYVLHGEMIPAGEHFERALKLTNDPLVRARLQCEAANSLVATGDPRGLEHIRQALSVLDPQTQPLQTAHALSIEGRFHHLAGHHGKAIELLKKAADLVKPIAAQSDLPTLASSVIPTIYAWLAGAYQHSGLFTDGDVWARQAVEFGDSHDILFSQALGNEFLGENASHRGEHEKALQYASREREIAAKLHSRERRAWTYLVTSLSHWRGGDWQRAEREFREGIVLAETIGELRLVLFIKGHLATLLADSAAATRPEDQLNGFPPREGLPVAPIERDRLLDDALQIALEVFDRAEALGLLYSRADARRILGHVRYRRGELEEAERVFAEAMSIVADTESKVSRLWLGPVYIQTVLALGKRAEAEGRSEEAKSRHEEAIRLAERYSEFTAACQSPRFTREAERLTALVNLT
jgi:tetratricopeptide (TPR) repeat protein